jgi:hypothetical protein
LITDETDLEELIGLVYTTGKEVEESSKVSEQQKSLEHKSGVVCTSGSDDR